LGDGTTTNKLIPTQIGIDNTWSQVASRNAVSFAIDTSNNLWAWGLNNNSQLGDNTTRNKSLPGRVYFIADFMSLDAQSIAAGGSHTAGTDVNNTLWLWGDNDHGQLGNGTNTDSGSPIQLQLVDRDGDGSPD
jgi:alpha-tubulin suppressor-like RCC1 family protein